jgi:hypothetical protein
MCQSRKILIGRPQSIDESGFKASRQRADEIVESVWSETPQADSTSNLQRRSDPETWVTERTGHMGDTFGPNGFSSGSRIWTHCVSSKHLPGIRGGDALPSRSGSYQSLPFPLVQNSPGTPDCETLVSCASQRGTPQHGSTGLLSRLLGRKMRRRAQEYRSSTVFGGLYKSEREILKIAWLLR